MRGSGAVIPCKCVVEVVLRYVCDGEVDLCVN